MARLGLEQTIALRNGMPVKEIAYSRAALKALRAMPANTSELIVSKIERYATNPADLANNVKMLKGEPGYLRLRIGDWRVVFSDNGEVISIVRIAPRSGVYD